MQIRSESSAKWTLRESAASARRPRDPFRCFSSFLCHPFVRSERKCLEKLVVVLLRETMMNVGVANVQQVEDVDGVRIQAEFSRFIKE